MNLDDIRVKEIEELNDEEKKFVSESWTKLTTEEQEYYKPLHAEGGGEFKLPFKSQEELDRYVAKQVETGIEAKRKVKEEEKARAKTSPEERFFPEGFKARDWNEAFTVALPKIRDGIIKEIQGMNQKQRDALDKINQEFDQEFDAIVTKNPGLPAKGTEERDNWEAEIAEVGTKYKLHTMTDAYEVWKALNSAKGGIGAESVAIATEGQPAKIANPASISRGYGTGNISPKTKYYVGGGKRLDDILEQRKRE